MPDPKHFFQVSNSDYFFFSLVFLVVPVFINLGSDGAFIPHQNPVSSCTISCLEDGRLLAACTRPHFLLASRMKKCDHIPEEKKAFLYVATNETVTDIFRKCHDDAGQNYDEKTLLFYCRMQFGIDQFRREISGVFLICQHLNMLARVVL